MNTKKDNKNIAIVILGIILVALIVMNIGFYVILKPSVKKQNIEQQKVEEEHSEDVSYSKDVENFTIQQKNTANTDNEKEQKLDSKENILDSEYIFEDSNSRFLDRSELEGLSKKELRLARNELYARHGFIFGKKDLQDYFGSKSWYDPSITPEEFGADEDNFNEYEIANRDLILEVEESK